ncbi:MAG: acyl-CoA dehydrogenase family protein [Thermoleophilia bacterium]|nr:acyl-CoA dehydrogenase family protein [Thermoleophilia bacterium]
MFELAVVCAKKRQAFGRLLASRRAIQNNVAQMATEIQVARPYDAAWKSSATRPWPSSSPGRS